MKVAIVGGGVVGLTTALQLQSQLRNVEITIFAYDFDDTVSHVAAGIFRVGSSYSGPNEQITREWIKESYTFYDDIRKSEYASIAGVTSVSGYIFGNSLNSVKNHWLEELVPMYRKATSKEFQLVGGNWTHGSFFSTLLTDCKLYLPWNMQKLRQNGVTINKKKVNSLKELVPEYDLILNCSGLGARDLCDDKRLVPMRGQIIKVAAPWIKTFFFGELDTYIIPGFNGVVTLGGSRNYGSENMQLCPYESAAIRERCLSFVPSLKNARTIQEKVGLRPHRESCVRVETEYISDGHRKAILVHNYGHGGYGVCTAPGTAKYAVQLAMDAHKSSVAKL